MPGYSRVMDNKEISEYESPFSGRFDISPLPLGLNLPSGLDKKHMLFCLSYLLSNKQR